MLRISKKSVLLIADDSSLSSSRFSSPKPGVNNTMFYLDCVGANQLSCLWVPWYVFLHKNTFDFGHWPRGRFCLVDVIGLVPSAHLTKRLYDRPWP